MPKTERYKKSQVARMLINPYATNMHETYPWLKDLIKDHGPSVDWNRYWPFVSLVYDPESPMIKDFSSMPERKKQAARDCDLSMYREEELRYIAIRYLQVRKNELWAAICSIEALYWQYVDKIAMPLEGDNEEMLKAIELQGKMTDRIDKMRISLKDYRKELLGDDTDLAETVEMSYTPEAQAKLMRLTK